MLKFDFIYFLHFKYIKMSCIKETKFKQIESRSKVTLSGENKQLFDYYVYTDGACSNNGSLNAKAGIGIYFGENDIRNVSQPVVGKQSNNTAELGSFIVLFDIGLFVKSVMISRSFIFTPPPPLF